MILFDKWWTLVCMRLCVRLFSSHFVTANEQRRGGGRSETSGRHLRSVMQRSYRGRNPPLTLLHTQSQTLSQKRIIICSAARELSPHIQLFASHFTLPFENRRGRGGVAWLFFIYFFIFYLRNEITE